MQITRNEALEQQIFDDARKSFALADEKRNATLHLSDMLSPKRAYWQRTMPLPLSEDEIQYFTIGRGHEDSLHRITGYKHVPSKEWNGMTYSVDFWLDVPAEMKTRRGYLPKEGEEEEKFESYLKQLKGYCAIEEKPTGKLIVWSLLEKSDDFRSKPKMQCYEVVFTEEELQAERERLLATRDALVQAIASKDPSTLPDCPEWQCVEKRTTLIVKPYCLTCKREFATDWGMDRHLESKTGKGHEYKRGQYNIEILPRCKWYQFCKGEQA